MINLNRNELDSIFSNFAEGILILNTKEQIVYFNTSYSKFTKLLLDEVYLSPITMLRPHAMAPKVLSSKAPILGELRKENEEEYFVNIYPLYDNNILIGCISVVTFLSNAKFLHDKIQDLENKQRYLNDMICTRNGTKYTFDDIIANSKLSIESKSNAQKASKSDISILLEGESGTGKEVYAQSIHNSSDRYMKPFVAINCGALASSVLESELFGYEDGAFTGSKKGGKIGLFESANHGTIFLDEISEMDLSTQVKLLRVLQEGSIRRVGSIKETIIDVRIICACNVNLMDYVNQGKFRKDLYYRIAVFHIAIPSLKERKSDIDELIDFYISRYEKKKHLKILITDQAKSILRSYDWPGNIRELKNAIDYSLFMISNNTIDVSSLPSSVLNYNKEIDDVFEPLSDKVSRLEKEIIQKAIDYYGNSVDGKKKAAKSLKISLATLYNKLGNN